MATKSQASTAERIDKLKIVVRPIDALHPYKRNARTHSDAQIAQIAASIDRFGFTNPILVGKDLGIIAGHGRVMAAKKLGLANVPTLMLDDLTPAERQAYILADNKLAESAGWDEELLKLEVADLSAQGFDLALTGFTAFEIEGLTMGPDSIDDVDESLGTFKLNKNVEFGSPLPYDLPELLPEMCSPIPDKLVSWGGKDATPDDGESFYLWQWRSDSIRGLPRDRFMVGFYVDDYRFECMWTDPDRYVAKMINLGCRISTTPNFTLYKGMPRARAIFETFKARWVGRFMQSCGIAVIPDVYGEFEERNEDFVLLGIPKGAPAISIQCHAFSGKWQDYLPDYARCVPIVEEVLEPQSILVYGNAPARKIFGEIKTKAPVIHVETRSQIRSRNVMGKKQDYL